MENIYYLKKLNNPTIDVVLKKYIDVLSNIDTANASAIAALNDNMSTRADADIAFETLRKLKSNAHMLEDIIDRLVNLYSTDIDELKQMDIVKERMEDISIVEKLKSEFDVDAKEKDSEENDS